MEVVRKIGAVGLLVLAAIVPGRVRAEYKSDIPSGQNIPKLEATSEDPKLMNGHVYPNWGPICQRYTYSVVYVDGKGREPEYVKIYFNGEMYEMEPALSAGSLSEEDYKKGVKYEYKFVPNKLGSNFYFFEASNGVGKARSNIIDSPDNGPVLFESDFSRNEVAVVDVDKQAKVLSYDMSEEWVGGVALSDDGKYLAVKTTGGVYLFDIAKPEGPVWVYRSVGESPGDVKGGVDISGDGSRVIASIGGSAILFGKENNKPIWVYKGSGNQAYNVAISKDGRYAAMGTAGSVSSTAQGYESAESTNLLIFWSTQSEVPLWQYHTNGNFHDVSLADDGSYVVGATGCPDRRFYLFAKDSNVPMIRSEMLTEDSPVHRAKISGDGQYAAVGSESNDGAVFVFERGSQTPMWKFSTPQRSSVRALNFTPDGQFVGAATFVGDVYIFERSTSVPVSHWWVNAALGGVDIADDGSWVAAGGTDKKLHVFRRGAAEVFSVDFNEYVEEVDIAANGKYVAAGTGGSVYFFEAFEDETSAVVCKEIKEPEPESQMRGGGNVGVDRGGIKVGGQWPGMLLGFGFLGSAAALAGYVVVVKTDLVSKLKKRRKGQAVQPEGERLLGKPKLDKRVVIGLGLVSAVFLGLTALAVVMNVRARKTQGEGGGLDQEMEAGCGNGMCEPDFGETRENCPGDCTEGN